MPKIQLKPRSPEFAEPEDRTSAGSRSCDMPGCAERGEYKAPRDRSLSDHYWFCMDHIRDYNSAWDFFAGMHPDEVEEHIVNSVFGDRPTWRSEAGPDMEDILRDKAQNFRGTGEYTQNGNGAHTGISIDRNTPEFEALAIMGLEPPVTPERIRIRYRELAKKHHPDRNGGCPKSEELLKRVNIAYTILKLSYAKYERLPEEKK